MEQHTQPPSTLNLPTPYEAAAEVIAAFPPARPRTRADGWTPERQRRFCEILADCGIVRDAAKAVGMTPQSAYELKRRPEGKGFALAWAAALLLARPRLVDLAIERAVDGNSEQYFKDGELVGERRKQDVRHLLATITKLENGQTGDMVIATIADDFDEFLDSMVAEAQELSTLPAPDHAAATARGKGKDRTKTASSPLQRFFTERECGPGLEGYEFEPVLERLSRRKALAQHAHTGAARGKTKKQRDREDEIWDDWDSNLTDPENF
ncbi:MAG: hypothetical protein RL481_1666 [Pseudomonadota bacterium]|jgi:hypothetical protein